MVDHETQISEFLERLKLLKYRNRFKEDGPLHVLKVDDFRHFLMNPNYLEQVGMTPFEINRFNRLCEENITEFQLPIHNIPLTKDKCDQLKKNNLNTSETLENKPRIISLKYKLLTPEHIMDSTIYNIIIIESILYYQLVSRIFQDLNSQIKEVNFQSVELYSSTGYPLAYSPRKYIKAISEWFLSQNELIFVYLKHMTITDQFKSSKVVTSIGLPIDNTDLIIQVQLSKTRLFFGDLKILISRQLHLHVDTIILKLFDVKKANFTIPNDRFELDISFIENGLSQIYIDISEYWGEKNYFGVFYSNLYTSYIDQRLKDWHHFNCLLLFLAKEQSEIKRDKLLEKLGLIRRISHSPPLVYAFFRLFTGLHLVLPHRIAINEGVLATISLLALSEEESKIIKFPQLWINVEIQASSEHKQSEIYLTKCIAKENKMDAETKQLRQVFPDTEEIIVTWKHCQLPLRANNITYKHISYFVSQARINERFTFKTPHELIKERLTYGLVRPGVDQLTSPTVFLGFTLGKENQFNFYSPQSGKCSSYKLKEIFGSAINYNNYIKEYPYKLFIMLDISVDMLCECQNETDQELYPNLALSIIEILLDRIIGLHNYLMVGIILISNDHSFPKGFLEFEGPTLEYKNLIEDVKTWISFNKPISKSSNYSRPSEGIIMSTLFHLMEKYPSKAEVYIFTCNGNKKYYGSKKNGLEEKLKKSKFIARFILLPDQSSSDLRRLSEISNGSYIDTDIVTSKIPSQNHKYPNLYGIPSHYLLEYFSHIQDQNIIILDYSELLKLFRNKLAGITSFLDQTQIKEECPTNLIHILQQISHYSKNPNPFIKLFSVCNEIKHFLSLIQGPFNTPFEKSVLFMEIRFEKYFPQYPPIFRFITTCYHPNILTSGEICHPILFEDYHPNVTLRQILDSIYDMLYTPVITHAVRYKSLEIFLFHKSLYDQRVVSAIERCNLRKSITDCLDSLNIDCTDTESHPVNYLCPLTKELLNDAVMTPEGYTYERHAILEHLKSSPNDPISHNPLTEYELIPNNAVMAAVYNYRRK